MRGRGPLWTGGQDADGTDDAAIDQDHCAEFRHSVISSIHRRHRAIEFKKFLAKIDYEIPEDLDIPLVCDNYGNHGAKYDADLRQMDGPGQSQVVVTIRPTRINAVDLSAV